MTAPPTTRPLPLTAPSLDTADAALAFVRAIADEYALQRAPLGDFKAHLHELFELALVEFRERIGRQALPTETCTLWLAVNEYCAQAGAQ